jgi:hypothetical protein
MLRLIAEFLHEIGKPKRQSTFHFLLLSISSSRQWMPYCRDWHCNTMTSHTLAALPNYVQKRGRSGSRGVSVSYRSLSGTHLLPTRNKMCTAHSKSRFEHTFISLNKPWTGIAVTKCTRTVCSIQYQTVQWGCKQNYTEHSALRLKQIKRQNKSGTQQNLKHEISECYCKPVSPRYHSSAAAANYSQYSNGANRHQHQWRSDQYPSTSRWVTSHAHNTPRREENCAKRRHKYVTVKGKWEVRQ